MKLHGFRQCAGMIGGIHTGCSYFCILNLEHKLIPNCPEVIVEEEDAVPICILGNPPYPFFFLPTS